jgi:hypothetical protein
LKKGFWTPKNFLLKLFLYEKIQVEDKSPG